MMFRLIAPAEKWLQKRPALWRLLDRHRPMTLAAEEKVEGHVAIVGYGRVGRHISNLLGQMNIPHLVIESNAENIEELNKRGIRNLYGDASNSEVLTHAGLEHARALVVAGPDESTSELVVASARDIAPNLPIIARATTEEGIKHLAELGAQDVIHPELEGGLEIVRHTLLKLDFPLQEIIRYMDAVRRDHYDMHVNTDEEHRSLHDLIHATQSIGVTWLTLLPPNPLIGQTLAEADLRVRTGASVVAILRDKNVMANPKSHTVFEPNDRIGFIGDDEQIESVKGLFALNETAPN
jgi:CPA2 family monovalent cation:H+ antiporter-2